MRGRAGSASAGVTDSLGSFQMRARPRLSLLRGASGAGERGSGRRVRGAAAGGAAVAAAAARGASCAGHGEGPPRMPPARHAEGASRRVRAGRTKAVPACIGVAVGGRRCVPRPPVYLAAPLARCSSTHLRTESARSSSGSLLAAGARGGCRAAALREQAGQTGCVCDGRGSSVLPTTHQLLHRRHESGTHAGRRSARRVGGNPEAARAGHGASRHILAGRRRAVARARGSRRRRRVAKTGRRAFWHGTRTRVRQARDRNAHK